MAEAARPRKAKFTARSADELIGQVDALEVEQHTLEDSELLNDKESEADNLKDERATVSESPKVTNDEQELEASDETKTEVKERKVSSSEKEEEEREVNGSEKEEDEEREVSGSEKEEEEEREVSGSEKEKEEEREVSGSEKEEEEKKGEDISDSGKGGENEREEVNEEENMKEPERVDTKEDESELEDELKVVTSAVEPTDDGAALVQNLPAERAAEVIVSGEIVEGAAIGVDRSVSVDSAVLAPSAPVALQPKTEMKSLTPAQLKTLYYNEGLENLDLIVDRFLSICNQSNHEFYDLLQSYLRALLRQRNKEECLKLLKVDADRLASQVWRTKTVTESVKGRCRDNEIVTIKYDNNIATLNREVHGELEEAQRAIRAQLAEELPSQGYACQLSWLAIELYIHRLYMEAHLLQHVPRNAPAQIMRPPSLSNDRVQLERLKQMLSVLFCFHRKPITDPLFVGELRRWTLSLGSFLIRVGDSESHLFLLNHLLRCPSGFSKWATALIQPVLPVLNEAFGLFQDHLFDHTVTMLALLLVPIKDRVALMQPMKTLLVPMTEGLSKASKGDALWVLVDSDGEMDEEGEEGWHRLHENDLVALLGQMPVDLVFRYVLSISTDMSTNEDLYQPLSGNTCSSAALLRLMAFVDQLLNILNIGLQTYSVGRYKQFNKRIARLVKHTVQFLTDHWEACLFILRATGRHDEVPQLQLQYEEEFVKAVRILLDSARLGSWQYLADFPYQLLSPTVKRSVLQRFFAGEDVSALEERIPTMPTAECIYLMTTLSNLGRDCNVNDESEVYVINEIVDAIFHLSFVCKTTRQLCSKVGRELLTGMALRHSYLLARVLDLVKRSIRQLEKVSIFLFRELPFHLFKPSGSEIETLTNWLTNTSVDSVENQLTRCVLSGMNWTGAPQGAALDIDLHRSVALMLIKAFGTHANSKTWTSVVVESSRQLSTLLRLTGPSSDTNFFAWTVHMITKLRLHWTSWPERREQPNARIDYRNGGRWEPVLEGIRGGNPLALYVAVTLMPHCDSDAEIVSSPGGTMDCTMDHLLQLLKLSHYRLVIEGLRLFVMLSTSHFQFLVKSEKFLQVIVALLKADHSYFQTFKKIIVDDFPGVLLSALVVMMLDLSDPVVYGLTGRAMLSFWLRILVRVPQWTTDRNCLFVLDRLLQHNLMDCVNQSLLAVQSQGQQQPVHVVDEGFEIISDAFQAYVDECVQNVRKRRGLSALFMGSTFSPWYSDSIAKEHPHVAFYLLRAHERMEDKIGLWPTLQQKLAKAKLKHKPKQVTELLPKVTKAIDFPLNYPTTALSIYLWGSLVEQLAAERPSQPLVGIACQRFFLRFFMRDSARWLGSLGLCYFESRALTTQLKHWRTALRNAIVELVEKANECGDGENNVLAETHRRRSVLLETMSLWIDEPRLHDSSLLLAALPPQYDSGRLSTVLEGQEMLWLDAFSVEEMVDTNLKTRINLWRKRHDNDWSLEMLGRQIVKSPKERILSRLKRQMASNPPPDLEPIKSPVASLSIECLADKNSLIVSLREPIELLVTFAHTFVQRQHRTTSLDLQHLEGLKQLMINRVIERTLSKPCPKGLQIAGVRAYGGCLGPAMVNARIQECARDDVVWNQLEANRAEFQQILHEGTCPPPKELMLASLFVDNAIDCLVALSQSSTEAMSLRTAAVESGVSLFYHLSSFFLHDTKTYPPTRHFLTESLEKLGHAFVRDNPAQTTPLLDALLKAPYLVEILSPHFSPVASPMTFVELYRRLLGMTSTLGPETTFSLLSKFEVREWLKRGQASEERMNFLECVCDGLRHCGSEPNQQMTIIYEVYKAHLRAVLKCDLVFFVAPAMKLCLRLAVDKALCADVWNEFFTLLNTRCDKGGELTMSIELLQNFIDDISSFFKAERQKHQRRGLFSHWEKHAVHVTEILSFLIVNLSMKLSRSAANKHIDPQQALGIVWTANLAVFSPWIAPQIVRSAGGLPWLPEEQKAGNAVLEVFCRLVIPIHDNFYQSFQHWTASIVCQRVWMFYSKDLLSSSQIPDYLVESYVSSLMEITLWSGWMADTAVLSDMTQLLRSRPSCLPTRRLIIWTLSQMGWSELHNPGTPYSEQLDYSDFLFNLCVCLLGSKESNDLLKTEAADALLDQLLKLSWHGLSAATFDLALRWFVVQSESARGLVSESVAPEAKLFRLFIVGAGMAGDHSLPLDLWEQPPGSPSQATIFNLLNKQICCLRAQVQLLQQGASKFQGSEHEAKRFSTAVINFLTQAEGTVAAIPKHEPRMNHGLLVANECLNLLRNCTPSRVREILRVYKEWIASSSASPLLLPLLHSVCVSPPSLHISAILAEEAITAYITAPHCDASWQAWDTVAATMTIDTLKVGDFEREAVSNCCLLCIFVRQLQLSQVEEKAGAKNAKLTKAIRLTEWMNSVELRPEDEPKSLLLWDRLLDLVVDLASAQSCTNQTLVLLNNWAAQLGSFAEDKSSAGLLGMIGLGKRSSLSVEYRFLCRAMSAYVLAQIPTNHVLRDKPNAPGHLRPEMTVTSRPIGAVLPTNQALVAVRTLRQLKTNKAYAAQWPWINHTLDFIGQPENSILETRTLLRTLAVEVFRGKKVIEVLRT